jgi:hypothetical protein
MVKHLLDRGAKIDEVGFVTAWGWRSRRECGSACTAQWLQETLISLICCWIMAPMSIKDD